MPTRNEQAPAQVDETDENVSPDECDHCCSTDVEYPYTTQGYLCGDCRHALQGTFKNVE